MDETKLKELLTNKNLHKITAICAIDEILPEIKNDISQYIIINSTKRKSSEIGHWIVLKKPQKQNKNIEFFDSLGLSPSNYSLELQNIIFKKYTKYVQMTKAAQCTNSTTCGSFVLFYISMSFKGHSIQYIQSLFSQNCQENEITVLMYNKYGTQ